MNISGKSGSPVFSVKSDKVVTFGVGSETKITLNNDDISNGTDEMETLKTKLF